MLKIVLTSRILFILYIFQPAETDQSVVSYFKENKLPKAFLTMLFVQFLLIMIDRILYLRKSMIGKIIFQIFSTIVLHIWLFVLLPYSTSRMFMDMPAAVSFYIIKCIYLLLSAYQIRSGFPANTSGNFLTKKYHLLNYICFLM